MKKLLLALAASLVTLAIVPVGMLGQLILGWLGPMTFLSALALLLSLWIGTANAVAVAYGLWLLQLMAGGVLLSTHALSALLRTPLLAAYRRFWDSPLLLIALAVLLASWAVWRVRGRESALPQQA